MRDTGRRVMLVLANGGRGGMQSQVLALATGLRDHGWSVTLAAGGHVDAPDGVRFVALPPFETRRLGRFTRALRAVVREERPDLLHGHGLRLAVPLALSGAAATVVTCHGLDPSRAKSTSRWVRVSRVPVIACGLGPQSVLARHGVANEVIDTIVIPVSGAHSRSDANVRFALSPAPLIVLPARFSPQKNHKDLLRALALVRERLGDGAPEAIFFGEGPLRESIERQAADVPGRPLAHCVNFEPDAASWLSAADFFVLTSTWEGQSGVVLEALARGLSVVTTTPTGVEDLIIEGRNGRRVADVETLADVIVEWCTDPDQRPRDEARTSEMLAKHSSDVIVAAHEAYYSRLAAFL